MKTELTWLNKINGADKIIYEYCERIMQLPVDHLYGAVLGSAYGGELEAIGKLWGDRGTIYGFDTFEGHPKHLVEDQTNFEVTCMDKWYRDDVYGMDKLTIDYQQGVLDKLGLDNVKLRKGLVHPNSCDEIPVLHYAFLDMDIYESMRDGYEAVKDKIMPGCCLFIHDATPPTHIPRVSEWFREEVMGDDHDMWTPAGEWVGAFLIGLRKNTQ